MLSTLNPACPLCGLRFENKPLLDLHIREDHRQRVFRERNDDSDPGSTRAPASGAENLPDPADPAATPAWTSKKAARPARRRRADRAKTALWRALRALHKSSANYGAPQVRLWASSHTAVPPRHGAPPQKRTLAWRMTARGRRVPVDEFHQRAARIDRTNQPSSTLHPGTTAPAHIRVCMYLQLCRACPGHEGGAMKVCDHASSRIRRVPRIFRYSGGEAIDIRQVLDATESPKRCSRPTPAPRERRCCVTRHGSSTVTANAGHPRSTLREAARGWPVSRRSPEGMWGRKERGSGARYLHAVTIVVPGVLHTCEIA